MWSGDAEGGFTNDWVNSHEDRAHRRQLEVRDVSRGRTTEYRTQMRPATMPHDMEEEERENNKIYLMNRIKHFVFCCRRSKTWSGRFHIL